MAGATLERVVEEAKSLTAEEQLQLRGLLESWQTEPQEQHETADDMEEREQLFLQDLLEKGLIAHLPMRDAQDDNYIRHAPIVMQGEPVSETIIRERR